MTTLSPIERWVARRSRAEDRRVTIADALIGGRWAAYSKYRLRFFAARAVLNTVLHGINLAILVRIFDTPDEIAAVAGAYALLGLGRAAWWGALEGLRERIRLMFQQGRGFRADEEISRWLRPALRAGGAGAAATAVVFAGYTAVRGPDAAVAFLAVAVLLTAIELPLRCYHSGLSSVRRVYRPLPVYLVLDVVGLAALIALWPLLGEWAAPAAGLIAGLAAAAATLYYTRRLYWFLGLNPGGRNTRVRRGELGVTRTDWLSGTASAAMSLDATLLVILALGGANTTVLASVIVVVLPGLAAGVDWANLFYFDLKRLGAAPFGQFRRQAAIQVERLGLVTGAAMGVVGMTIATLAVPDVSTSIVFALGPLFVARSLLAGFQVRAFTEGAYRRVATASLAVVLVSIGAIWVDNDAAVLLVLAAANIPGIALLWRSPTLGPGARPGLPWSFAEWLPHVVGREGPVLILLAHLESYHHPLDPESAALGVGRDQVTRLAAENPHATVTLIGATQIGLALTPGTEEEWVTRETLVGGAAGLLAGLDVLEHPSGVEALAALHARLREPDQMLAESQLPPDADADVNTIDSVFTRLVRSGSIGGPSRRKLSAELPGIERQELLAAAVHHATYGVPRAGGRFEVSTVTVDGAISRYYAIPQRVPKRVRAQWRATVIDAWFAVALRTRSEARLTGAPGDASR